MSGLIGVNNAAEKISKILVGVNDTAAKVVRVLGGDENGIAQLLWSGELVHIPTMEDATTPSGTVTRSSVYDDNADYAAYLAFDKDPSSRWTSKFFARDPNRWVAYDFGYAIKPVSAYVRNYCSNGNAWAFVIEGSADGSTWTVLVDCSANAAQVDTTYTITTASTYRYFRYRCTNGANTYAAGVYEFDVWGYKS